MAKYFVKDAKGKRYIVSDFEEEKELEEEKFEDEDEEIKVEEKTEELHDEPEAQLSAEEISALKGLAAVAGDLMKLLAVEKEEHAEDKPEGEPALEDSEDDVDGCKDEEEEKEEDEEEILETKSHDAAASFGANQKQPKVNDSIDLETEINEAWSKRFKQGGDK